jgi:hypothetical protein
MARHRFRPEPFPPAELLGEVFDQQRNIARALPERRNADRDNVKAIQQILAEFLLFDGLLQIHIGGRDHARI